MTPKRYEALKKGLTFIEFLINSQSVDLTNYLHEVSVFLSEMAGATSCLIYVVNDDKKSMSLVGTIKGRRNFIEKLVIRKGEGITGWVAEHKKTVFISKKAYQDARFKFIKGLPEDKYEGFLSVPIMLNKNLIGVVNLQYPSPVQLTKNRIEMIESLVHILAYSFSIYVLQREVIQLTEKLEARKLTEKAKGILMEKFKLSENEAFDRLRSESMRQRKKIEELATSVILLEKVL